jgi:hypothetical protein
MQLPDIELVSSAVHEAWMDSKKAQGVATRKAEDGEELMVPYEQLSEKAKNLDRGSVQAVYSAIEKSLKTTDLTFGQATDAALSGKKVARVGWNGANMYAVIMPGYPEGIGVNEATAKAHEVPAGHIMKFRPYWALWTAQKDVASWAPSGSDTLAEDWQILN